MELMRDDVRQIVTEIVSGMLGIDAEPVDSVNTGGGGRQLSGCVQLTGDWHGAVVVTCPELVARTMTSAMLGVPEAEAQDADVRDAVGELANMAAGNVKGLIDVECALSLPTVTEGTDLMVSIRGGRVMSETAYACPSGSFTVLVVEKEDTDRCES